jgi:Tol biopolymer transport system component
VLVYQSGVASSISELLWLDRTGTRIGSVGQPANFTGIRLSPDGRQIAVNVLNASGTEGDIWFYNEASGLSTRFTFDPAVEQALVWSPDGQQVIAGARRPSGPQVFRKSSNGNAEEERLNIETALSGAIVPVPGDGGPGRSPSDWSPDGRSLLFFAESQLWVLPLSPQQKPSPWMPAPGTFRINGQFDPTGHWVAYQSNESGQTEVYVAAFPGPGVKRQVSTGGGTLPRWRRDGKELFYIAADDSIVAAAVTSTDATFDVKGVRPLFKTRRKLLQNGVGYPYDVSPDGTRFLINTTPEVTAQTPITVVLNWPAGL